MALEKTHRPALDQESASPSLPRHRSSLRLSCALLAALALVVVFFVDCISEPVRGWRLTSSLFRPTLVGKSLDVVVAHYREEPARVANMTTYLRQVARDKGLRVRVILYSKQPLPDNHTRHDGDLLAHDTGADEVRYLPNIGREGETYLRHITERYKGGAKRMADWTLFTQAGMFGFASAEEKDGYLEQALHDGFQPDSSYVSLAIPSFHHTSFCGKVSSGQVWPRLSEISNLVHNVKLCSEEVLISWTGQFIVSRQAVLSQPLATYQALHAPFHEPADSGVHQPHAEAYCQELLDANGGVVDVSNPCWGHSIERSWNMLFGCAQPALLDDCRAGKSCGCRL